MSYLSHPSRSSRLVSDEVRWAQRAPHFYQGKHLGNTDIQEPTWLVVQPRGSAGGTPEGSGKAAPPFGHDISVAGIARVSSKAFLSAELQGPQTLTVPFPPSSKSLSSQRQPLWPLILLPSSPHPSSSRGITHRFPSSPLYYSPEIKNPAILVLRIVLLIIIG